MSSPTVSVIIPVYNGEQYLRIAIDSVLAQTFTDLELVVVDDGSTDSTAQIARSYGQRLTYLFQLNAGAAAAFNHGIRASHGRYISWLSSDDACDVNKLAEQVAALRAVGEPAACFTDATVIDANGRTFAAYDLPHVQGHEMLRHVFVPGLMSVAAYSLVFDRACLARTGLYDEAQKYTQDADMLVKLARYFPLLHVPQRLVFVRRHPDSGCEQCNHQWRIAATAHYVSWLKELTIDELFPELVDSQTRRARANARVWIGDQFAKGILFPARIARGQYWRALREHPFLIGTVIQRITSLYNGNRARGSDKRRRSRERLAYALDGGTSLRNRYWALGQALRHDATLLGRRIFWGAIRRLVLGNKRE